MCCYLYRTRKSSCVNARGIPTAVYQVTQLSPKVGYPPTSSDGGYPRWGTPPVGVPPTRSDWGTQGGVPPAVPPGQVQWGYPRWGPPGQGYPPPHWTWLGYPPPHLDLAGVTPPPPVWTDRQMDGWTDSCQNITFPRTTYAVGTVGSFSHRNIYFEQSTNSSNMKFIVDPAPVHVSRVKCVDSLPLA